MTIKVTLNYGPIEAEISGEDRDEVQTEMLEFIQFLNENEDDLELSLPHQQSTADVDEDAVLSGQEDGDDHPLASIADELGVSIDALDDIVYVDPELEEDPRLLIDPDDLGDSTVEQQRNAAYLILHVWDECYSNNKMKSSKIKDILELGGVSSNNLYRAWQDKGQRDFKISGEGRATTAELTGVGERTAKTVLKDLVSADS